MAERDRDKIGLPARPFFYTIDQIASLLQVSELQVTRVMLHYEGRSAGVCPPDKLRAININPEDGETKPDWRVEEKHLTGWLKRRGVRYYTRGYFR